MVSENFIADSSLLSRLCVAIGGRELLQNASRCQLSCGGYRNANEAYKAGSSEAPMIRWAILLVKEPDDSVVAHEEISE